MTQHVIGSLHLYRKTGVNGSDEFSDGRRSSQIPSMEDEASHPIGYRHITEENGWNIYLLGDQRSC